jgi:threonine-phosphate decarboxylase
MEYQHGGDIYANNVTIDYSANINPLGLPHGVKEALFKAADSCSCYPDSRSMRLRKELARFHGVSTENIICGNGAADLIFQIVQALKPKNALLIAPSFLEYEQALKASSCNIFYYSLKEENGFQLYEKDFTEWLEKSGIDIQMMFLCNPNNPTGFAAEKEAMAAILKYSRDRGIFCVVDECFNEFLPEPDRYSVLDLIGCGGYENVFLLKAFTKLYAMAGLRLGYGICTGKEVLDQMDLIRQPWSVSSIAQAAGEAALMETEYVEKTRQVIACEREYLKSTLSSLGFQVFDSMANYIFFRDLRPEALSREKMLYNQLLDRKVLIRSCSNYRGLDDTYYRICVKQRKENEEFLSILKSIVIEGK